MGGWGGREGERGGGEREREKERERGGGERGRERQRQRENKNDEEPNWLQSRRSNRVTIAERPWERERERDKAD